jgi:hypothetical protein
LSLVQNERTKLTATWLNTLPTALVAAGAFAPLAALLYGIAELKGERASALALAAGCLALGTGLHLLGRALLGRLRP